MTARALTTGIRWCPACIVKAQQRGTVRSIPNERALEDDSEPAQLLALWYGGRVGGELWSVVPPAGALCNVCAAPLAIAFEVRPARRSRGLGQSPREAAQRPLLFGRRNG